MNLWKTIERMQWSDSPPSSANDMVYTESSYIQSM